MFGVRRRFGGAGIKIGRPERDVRVNAESGRKGGDPCGFRNRGIVAEHEGTEIALPVKRGFVRVEDRFPNEINHSAVKSFCEGVALGVIGSSGGVIDV